MGRVKRLCVQFGKFGLVGMLCFGIDYGFMIALTELLHMEYFVSAAVSFVASVIVNYVLSMRYVFRGRKGMRKLTEIGIFITLSALGLVLNQMIMWIAVEFFHIFYAWAKIFATLLVTTYNFISRKVFLEA